MMGVVLEMGRVLCTRSEGGDLWLKWLGLLVGLVGLPRDHEVRVVGGIINRLRG